MLIVSFQKMKGKGKYINQEIGGKRSFLEKKENERSKKKDTDANAVCKFTVGKAS